MPTSSIQSYSAQVQTVPPREKTFPAGPDAAAALRSARSWVEQEARAVLEKSSLPKNPWDAGAKARAFIAEHRLGDGVRLHGPSTDTPRLHRAADLFIQPSHFEAFGISIVEAMASQVPVLGNRAGKRGMRVGGP